MTNNPSKCQSLSGSELTLMISLFHLMALFSILPIQCNFLVSVSIKILVSTFMLRRQYEWPQVARQFRNLIPTHAKKMRYLAYFLPHLTYCFIVWFHCGKQNEEDIIEKLRIERKSTLQFKSLEHLDISISYRKFKARLLMVYRSPPSKKNQLTLPMFYDEFSRLIKILVNSQILWLLPDILTFTSMALVIWRQLDEIS